MAGIYSCPSFCKEEKLLYYGRSASVYISSPRYAKCKLTVINDTPWFVSKTYSPVKEQIALEHLLCRT